MPPARPVDPASRMDSVPVVAVGSGKGGVGKTSVAISLARDLAATGRRVGLLDADLSGPDVPRMLGIRRDAPAESVQLTAAPGTRHSSIEAVSVDGLQVASAGFLLGGQQGLALAAPLAELLLARLVRQTVWGPLDVLVVDLPPGTGDTQAALLRMYAQVAVLLVVSPDEVAHLDTGRAVEVLRQARAYLLGGIENMAYLECPDCGARSPMFAEAPADRTIWALGVPRLAQLPFRPGGAITPEDVRPASQAISAYLAG